MSRILLPHPFRPHRADPGLETRGGEVTLETDGRKLFLTVATRRGRETAELNLDQAEQLAGGMMRAARELRMRLLGRIGEMVGGS